METKFDKLVEKTLLSLNKETPTMAAAGLVPAVRTAGPKALPALRSAARRVGDFFRGTGKKVAGAGKDAGKYGVETAIKNPKAVVGLGAGGAGTYLGYKTLDQLRQATLGMTPEEQAEFFKNNPGAADLLKPEGLTGIFKNPVTGKYSPGRLAVGAGAGIGAKLAYDHIKDKLARKRKKEDEEA